MFKRYLTLVSTEVLEEKERTKIIHRLIFLVYPNKTKQTVQVRG